MILDLVKDLLHLEGRSDSLEENGGPNGPLRNPHVILGGDEDVVPEPAMSEAYREKGWDYV